MDERGFSLIELLVSTLLGSLILTAALVSFTDTTKHHHNHKTSTVAEDRAQYIMDTMISELRLIGNGLPLGQSNFLIQDSVTGDAALPLLLSSEEDFIAFRINERGSEAMLTEDWTPSSFTLDFKITDTSNFKDGDTVYISDWTVGGSNGLQGTVVSVTSNQLSISSSYVAKPGTDFITGSLVQRVSEVHYQSFDDWSGILRTSDDASPFGENTKFSIEYLDDTSTPISTPLTKKNVSEDLAALRLSVTVRGKATLKSGEDYEATIVQTIGLRNLYINKVK